MSYTKKELSVMSTDGIHTLKGVAYIPQGEIRGVFHLVHGQYWVKQKGHTPVQPQPKEDDKRTNAPHPPRIERHIPAHPYQS